MLVLKYRGHHRPENWSLYYVINGSITRSGYVHVMMTDTFKKLKRIYFHVYSEHRIDSCTLSLHKAIRTWNSFSRFVLWSFCHGMTKLFRKTNWLTKNAIFTILASFVCFFNFPDRNLIILYKIIWKLPFHVRQIRCPFSGSTSCTKITQRTADLLLITLFCLIVARIIAFYPFLLFLFMPLALFWPEWCKDPCFSLSIVYSCLNQAWALRCFQCLEAYPNIWITF